MTTTTETWTNGTATIRAEYLDEGHVRVSNSSGGVSVHTLDSWALLRWNLKPAGYRLR